MLDFTESDVRQSFGDTVFNRGKGYHSSRAVTRLEISPDRSTVAALVNGRASVPYEVSVKISANRTPQGKTRAAFSSECTCPVRHWCKHAVAALLEAISEDNRRRENIRNIARNGESGLSADARRERQQANWQLRAWLDSVQAKETKAAAQPSRVVVYLIGEANPSPRNALRVKAAMAGVLKDGRLGKPQEQGFSKLAANSDYYNSPLLPEDKTIVKMAAFSNLRHMNYLNNDEWIPPNDPELIDLFMRRVISSGRAYLRSSMSGPLRMGEEVPAELRWTVRDDGSQIPSLVPRRDNLIPFLCDSPWYLDPKTMEMGPLRCSASADKIAMFLNAPVISLQDAAIARKMISGAALPLPEKVRMAAKTGKDPKTAPTPILILSKHTPAPDSAIIASLSFDYEGHIVDSAPSSRYAVKKGDEMVLMERNSAAEYEAVSVLNDAISFNPDGDGFSPWFWPEFVHETAPFLKERGFRILGLETVDLRIATPDNDDIDASLEQGAGGDWWFALDLGIQIDGKRVPLLPLLVAMLRQVGTTEEIDRLTAGKKCYAPLPDGSLIALPSERMRAILKTLFELFENDAVDKDGKINVPLDMASAVLRLDAITRHRWTGEAKLRRLVEKLGDFAGIPAVPLPDSLNAELRPYQKQGYDWLHFLGGFGLGGVLADDMGLGKTVQALAYLLSVKQSGRFKLPNLVVMPTSLVGNWISESQRFAPDLKVLSLHGSDRSARFEEIKKADLVITTYPLVGRDIETLCRQKWGLAILDEAQAIKNAAAKTTQAVCRLEAQQRLCLSGTPVENHLGEAWSLFSFLMPGILGSHAEFTKRYRTPIEKRGDADRKDLLARRLKPFVLRRLKSNVATELPPRTDMVRRVALPDDQRDLYETVRHAMNEKVLEEISNKGFNRSRIVILDALLKLRQVCCDPRLVKMKAASGVKSSAKLAELMEMLPTLIEEGRRILLFSQFTSMLDLIKKELAKTDIAYVELRGTTKDRRTPITEFQSGKVPLFLISLKAGGVGLNLTAADTVIHFDPWWNPAVENQATDRAHRIGQDKPVFVYKLIAEGTVEERILELQSRKAELAQAIFGGDGKSNSTALTKEDLQWLLG